MPRTPGRFLSGVALDLDESYARMSRERPLHLRRRGPPPGTTSYSRHADEQRSKEAVKKAQAADQAKRTTVEVAWKLYPSGVGRKMRVQSTPSTGTPGVRVHESTDWRNLNSNTPSCSALEKMAKFKQDKAELRRLRKSMSRRAHNDPNRFRPSWMQVEKPKRKPGEGLPTTSIPGKSLKSGGDIEANRRSRKKLEAAARLSPLASRLEGIAEPDPADVRALRKRVKKMYKKIRSGNALLRDMKSKRDLF